MAIWEWFDKIDKSIFKAIHVDGAVPALDDFIILLRNQYLWIPLYVFIIYWIFRFHRQHALKFVLLSLVCFAITDLVSFQILKPMIGRLRPCYDKELASVIRHLVLCGGRESMPSSHAANHFGLAAAWFFIIKMISGRKWYWLFFWALIICYAQVYAGKHYPFDILVGAIFGIAAGYGMYKIFRKWSMTKTGKK